MSKNILKAPMLNTVTRWVNEDIGQITDSLVSIDNSGNLATLGSVTTSQLKIDANNNFLNFVGSGAQATDITLTFPAALGAAGQFLRAVDANGNLEWSTGDGTGTVTSVALTSSSFGVTVSGSPITDSGMLTVDINAELQGLAGLSALGLVSRTQVGTYEPVSITAGVSNNLLVSNGNGVNGNPTIDLNSTLTGLNSISANTVNAAVSVNTGTMNASLTDEEIAALTAVQNGTIVYNTTNASLNVYSNNTWHPIAFV